MSTGADELVLFADNDADLYRQSFKPIVENLKKKLAKGTYDPVLAQKLWRYHADRAAQKYAKGYGTPWHKMFSTADRNEAAAHWESYARREYLGVTSHDRSRRRARTITAKRRAVRKPARRRVAKRDPKKRLNEYAIRPIWGSKGAPTWGYVRASSALQAQILFLRKEGYTARTNSRGDLITSDDAPPIGAHLVTRGVG